MKSMFYIFDLQSIAAHYVGEGQCYISKPPLSLCSARQKQAVVCSAQRPRSQRMSPPPLLGAESWL